ncbi:hypothetical protein DFH94DRAFT_687610 [Russula ochroleuca]|uniref:Transposase n=1 Tax=Russula ochroleuca TaxID=152965 RepID=A0A9P5N5U3_9AGAM|nr:hypothetical protein DFH94DRAFT_699987 [Russula ochroleuca]KAF8487123.1 hypothetical protein DFH94DRAFT_687610 [Russula ochroleuca]
MPANNNPTGKNQYKDCPPLDDPRVAELLREYHRKGIMNRWKIREMFCHEGIFISEATISRRRKELGLLGSGTATRKTPVTAKRQMVLDQMAKDPTSRQGPKTIQKGILFDTGICLTRDYIRHEMRAQDPGGFAIRDPYAGKKVFRVPLVSLGPHHE